MATRTKKEITPENVNAVTDEELDEELEETAKESDKLVAFDPLTTVVVQKEKIYDGPYVDGVFIPALEDTGNGMKVDQYEHVTIANEHKEICWKVLRGEPVSVPVPVFIVLKQRYPKL